MHSLIFVVKIHDGDCSIEAGHPDGVIRDKVEADPRQASLVLSTNACIIQATAVGGLKSTGEIQKFGPSAHTVTQSSAEC